MNYVYDPVHQAQIESVTSTTSRRRGPRSCCSSRTRKIANNKLIFPDEQFTAKCDSAPTISGEEEQRITQAFEGRGSLTG